MEYSVQKVHKRVLVVHEHLETDIVERVNVCAFFYFFKGFLYGILAEMVGHVERNSILQVNGHRYPLSRGG